jgi:type II secretory pathway predicted ATPase ExeA
VTYWRYWKLNASPFTNDPSQPLFRGATVEEALARIEFLISNRRQVASLLGASGVGKSTLLRYCASNPPISREVPCLQIVRTSIFGLREGELLSELATRLCGVRNGNDQRAAWQSLRDYFRAASSEGVQTALLVDDTESASAAGEADLIRLLSVPFPLTVVFAVEAQMTSAVSRSLFDRCELQIELPGWDYSQTAEFLGWTTQRLGRQEPIFTDTAVSRIQELSQGVARRIIQIADLSLVAGAVQQTQYIDHDCVEQVAFELPRSVAA